MQIAGLLMLLNAALHIVGYPVSGFSADAIKFVIVGVVYGLVGLGLMRGMRWLAFLMFVLALIGGNIAFMSMGSPPLPSWLSGSIALNDLVVAIVLFGVLWNAPRRA